MSPDEHKKMPRTMTLVEAAKITGYTSGGLRGAVLRGRLRAEKDRDGRLVVQSYNLAAFHLYGNDSLYPEEKMRPFTRVVLHNYLETVCCG